jgi:hypothetical protein
MMELINLLRITVVLWHFSCAVTQVGGNDTRLIFFVQLFLHERNLVKIFGG